MHAETWLQLHVRHSHIPAIADKPAASLQLHLAIPSAVEACSQEWRKMTAYNSEMTA
jgi:hypothetical protein